MATANIKAVITADDRASSVLSGVGQSVSKVAKIAAVGVAAAAAAITAMTLKGGIARALNIEDAQEADKVFDMLMGTDVPARKSFIQSNAKMANLDI